MNGLFKVPLMIPPVYPVLSIFRNSENTYVVHFPFSRPENKTFPDVCPAEAEAKPLEEERA